MALPDDVEGPFTLALHRGSEPTSAPAASVPLTKDDTGVVWVHDLRAGEYVAVVQAAEPGGAAFRAEVPGIRVHGDTAAELQLARGGTLVVRFADFGPGPGTWITVWRRGGDRCPSVQRRLAEGAIEVSGLRAGELIVQAASTSLASARVAVELDPAWPRSVELALAPACLFEVRLEARLRPAALEIRDATTGADHPLTAREAMAWRGRRLTLRVAQGRYTVTARLDRDAVSRTVDVRPPITRVELP